MKTAQELQQELQSLQTATEQLKKTLVQMTVQVKSKLDAYRLKLLYLQNGSSPSSEASGSGSGSPEFNLDKIITTHKQCKEELQSLVECQQLLFTPFHDQTSSDAEFAAKAQGKEMEQSFNDALMKTTALKKYIINDPTLKSLLDHIRQLEDNLSSYLLPSDTFLSLLKAAECDLGLAVRQLDSPEQTNKSQLMRLLSFLYECLNLLKKILVSLKPLMELGPPKSKSVSSRETTRMPSTQNLNPLARDIESDLNSIANLVSEYRTTEQKITDVQRTISDMEAKPLQSTRQAITTVVAAATAGLFGAGAAILPDNRLSTCDFPLFSSINRPPPRLTPKELDEMETHRKGVFGSDYL